MELHYSFFLVLEFFLFRYLNINPIMNANIVSKINVGNKYTITIIKLPINVAKFLKLLTNALELS